MEKLLLLSLCYNGGNFMEMGKYIFFNILGRKIYMIRIFNISYIKFIVDFATRLYSYVCGGKGRFCCSFLFRQYCFGHPAVFYVTCYFPIYVQYQICLLFFSYKIHTQLRKSFVNFFHIMVSLRELRRRPFGILCLKFSTITHYWTLNHTQRADWAKCHNCIRQYWKLDQ